MPESMSATDAIRSVAQSLNDAAMMLDYIARSLDHEFALAAERGNKLRQKALPSENMGGLDDWEF